MYYRDDENYYPRLYCEISNKYCIFSKRCDKVNKYIEIENNKWKECFMYIESKAKEIPNGSYFVQSYRPNRSGKLYLYVVMKDKVERILSDFTTINQDYIYVKEGLDGYEVSLMPFKTTTRKAKSEEKQNEQK
jgi:hypothetical protein